MLEFLERHGLTIVAAGAGAALAAIVILAIVTSGPEERILAYVQTVAIIIAFPLLLWRSIIAGRHADSAARQAGAASDTERETRFVRGVELLGNENPAARHAGMQMLRRLSREEPALYDEVVGEVLALAGESPPAEAGDG